MKKIIAIVLLCAVLMTFTACDGRKYSFEDATGYEVGRIEYIETNNGYLQSFRQTVDVKHKGLLDLEFVKTDKDIYSLTEGFDPNGTADLAVWVRGMIYVKFSENTGIDFVFGLDDRIYCYSPLLNMSLMSTSVLDSAFFEQP